jgi:hypothetical protein
MEERRRSQRLPLSIPIRVYGRTPRNHPFRDLTATMTVSLNGGLLDMKPRVKVGQKILVVHGITEEERECLVVSVDGKRGGRKKVAVEFSHPVGDFWHTYGPPVSLKAAPSARPAASAEEVPHEEVPETVGR